MGFQEKLFHLFPPPEFLQTRSAGLSIEEDAVRFVEFGFKKGQLVLEQYGEEVLPEGVIVRGEVKDPVALQGVLKNLRKKYSLRFVRSSIPEQKSFIVRMEIPRVPNAEIKDAVETQIEEYVPVKTSESIFDYKVLGIVGRECDRLDLEVTVVEEKVAQNYLQVFGETGLSLTSFENEAQSVGHAVVPEGDPRTFMVVDFGTTETGIYIVANGSVEFTTSIDLSGKKLTTMLEDKYGLSPEEAKDAKDNFDASALAVNEEKESTAIIMSFISAFRDEINKYYVYWQTHKDGGKEANDVEKIILCGAESILGGLSEYLSSSLNAPVVMANVWENLFDFDEYIPSISRRDSFQYAAAIGLALPSTGHRFEKKKKERAQEKKKEVSKKEASARKNEQKKQKAMEGSHQEQKGSDKKVEKEETQEKDV